MQLTRNTATFGAARAMCATDALSVNNGRKSSNTLK